MPLTNDNVWTSTNANAYKQNANVLVYNKGALVKKKLKTPQTMKPLCKILAEETTARKRDSTQPRGAHRYNPSRNRILCQALLLPDGFRKIGWGVRSSCSSSGSLSYGFTEIGWGGPTVSEKLDGGVRSSCSSSGSSGGAECMSCVDGSISVVAVKYREARQGPFMTHRYRTSSTPLLLYSTRSGFSLPTDSWGVKMYQHYFESALGLPTMLRSALGLI